MTIWAKKVSVLLLDLFNEVQLVAKVNMTNRYQQIEDTADQYPAHLFHHYYLYHWSLDWLKVWTAPQQWSVFNGQDGKLDGQRLERQTELKFERSTKGWFYLSHLAPPIKRNRRGLRSALIGCLVMGFTADSTCLITQKLAVPMVQDIKPKSRKN